MLDYFIKSIIFILTISALLAAIVYPIQVFKYYVYMLEWSYSDDKKERKKLNSYMLLAFIGICILLFGGIRIFLWWIPDSLKFNESISSRDLASGVVAILLTAFLFEYLYKLPKKLNDLRLYSESIDEIKAEVRSEDSAKTIVINNLKSANLKLSDKIEELMSEIEDLKCNVKIANNQNDILKIMVEKNSSDNGNE